MNVYRFGIRDYVTAEDRTQNTGACPPPAGQAIRVSGNQVIRRSFGCAWGKLCSFVALLVDF